MEGKEMLESCWQTIQLKGINQLEECLKKSMLDYIFSKEDCSLIYTSIYNLCTGEIDYSSLLYKRYINTITKYLETYVKTELESKKGMDILLELHKHWTNHHFMLKWLLRFFGYLNRYYAKIQGVSLLDEKGMELFRTTILNRLKKI